MAIEEENGREHQGADVCKGEMCQASGRSGRRLCFMFSALTVWSAVQMSGESQHLTAPDVTVMSLSL